MATQFGQQYYSAFKPADAPKISGGYGGMEVALKMGASQGGKQVKEVPVPGTAGDYNQWVAGDKYFEQQENQHRKALEKLIMDNKDLTSPEVIAANKQLVSIQTERENWHGAFRSIEQRDEDFKEYSTQVTNAKASTQTYLVEGSSPNAFYAAPQDILNIHKTGRLSTIGDVMDIQFNAPSIAKTPYGTYSASQLEKPFYHEANALGKGINTKASFLAGVYEKTPGEAGIIPFESPYGKEFYFMTNDFKTNANNISAFLQTASYELGPDAMHELYEKANKDVLRNIMNYNHENQQLGEGMRVMNDMTAIIEDQYKNRAITKEQRDDALKNLQENRSFENQIYRNFESLKKIEEELLAMEISGLAETDKELYETKARELDALRESTYSGFTALVDTQANKILGSMTGQMKIYDHNVGYNRISDLGASSGIGDVYTTPITYTAVGGMSGATPIDMAVSLDNGIKTTIAGWTSLIEPAANYVIGGESVSEENTWKLKGQGATMIFSGDGNTSGTPFEFSEASNIGSIFEIADWGAKALHLVDPIIKKDGTLGFPDIAQSLIMQEENYPGMAASMTAISVDKNFRGILKEALGGTGLQKQTAREQIIDKSYKIFNESNPQYFEYLNDRITKLNTDIDNIRKNPVNHEATVEGTKSKPKLKQAAQDVVDDYEAQIKSLNPKNNFRKFMSENMDTMFEQDNGNYVMRDVNEIMKDIGTKFTTSPYMIADVKITKEAFENLSDAEKIELRTKLGAKKSGRNYWLWDTRALKVDGDKIYWEGDDEYVIVPNVYINLETIDTNILKHKSTEKESDKNIQKQYTDDLRAIQYSNVK